MSGLLSLPNELLDIVCEKAVFEPWENGSLQPTVRQRTSTALSLMRVSRRFLSIAEPLLYRKIVIDRHTRYGPQQERMLLLAVVLIRSERKASMVHHVYFADDYDPKYSRRSRLESDALPVDCHGLFVREITRIIPGARRAHLRRQNRGIDSEFWPWDDISSWFALMLTRLRSLRSLSLYGKYLLHWPMFSELTSALTRMAKVHGQEKPFSKLHTVILDHGQPRSEYYQHRYLEEFEPMTDLTDGFGQAPTFNPAFEPGTHLSFLARLPSLRCLVCKGVNYPKIGSLSRVPIWCEEGPTSTTLKSLRLRPFVGLNGEQFRKLISAAKALEEFDCHVNDNRWRGHKTPFRAIVSALAQHKDSLKTLVLLEYKDLGSQFHSVREPINIGGFRMLTHIAISFKLLFGLSEDSAPSLRATQVRDHVINALPSCLESFQLVHCGRDRSFVVANWALQAMLVYKQTSFPALEVMKLAAAWVTNADGECEAEALTTQKLAADRGVEISFARFPVFVRRGIEFGPWTATSSAAGFYCFNRRA